MYYDLLRTGEVTKSDHIVKAKDIHVAINKPKILIILYSSKTHSRANRLQEVKITAISKKSNLHFCPFNLIHTYLMLRGGYD